MCMSGALLDVQLSVVQLSGTCVSSLGLWAAFPKLPQEPAVSQASSVADLQTIGPGVLITWQQLSRAFCKGDSGRPTW